MGKITIYHNPRCSKSRATLSLLEERGFQPRVVHYLEDPPSAGVLRHLLKALSMSPRELMRKKEEPYRDLNLDNDSLSDTDLINAMIAHPVLIERPIVQVDGQAAIGRPPENVLEILP